MKDFFVEKEWKEVLGDYCKSDSFLILRDFIQQEYQIKKVYPQAKAIFKAFELTPFSQVKVVILGQDPYHGDGQATGLSFSVPEGCILPPSLKNIYKEIETDVHSTKDFISGDLESWAKQGVFLLNAVLTVVAQSPLSHQKKGWEEFTDIVIKNISEKREGVVFMLWGNFAKSKKQLIDTSKHLVLEASHPSPFSARNGFFGCKHFSKCNIYLQKQNKKEIIW
jgi:uracil-DNA glycosylase